MDCFWTRNRKSGRDRCYWMSIMLLCVSAFLRRPTNTSPICSLVVNAFETKWVHTAAHHQRFYRNGLKSTHSFPFGQKRLWQSSSSSDNNINNNSNNNNNNDDSLAAYYNKNNVRDQVVSALSGDGGIKVTAATVRNLINEGMLQHTLTAVPADALGRTIICALLLSNGVQDEQVVQITMNGDGPLRGVVALSSGRGHVRGYVGTPALGSDLTLADAVGRRGSVQVVKNHPDWPRPYNGITAIRHGDIDRDVGIYLAESEQRSCALAAATAITGVLCKAGGGYLIEQLPGVTTSTIEKVETNLAKLVRMDGGERLPTNLLLNGVTPLEIAQILLEGLDMQILQQIEPKMVCECTEDRLMRSLRLLPPEDVNDILEKEERVEARCQFCGKVYRIEAADLRQRLATATSDPSKE